MRVLLAVYLAIAQSLPGAVALAPPPPSIAEISTARLAAQLMEREKASWFALQRRDRGAWLALVGDDYFQVDAEGTLTNREGAFDMFSAPMIDDYSTHYLRGTLVSPTVFVLTYWIARKLDGGDHPSAARFTSCSIWAKRNGAWMRIRYQETPVMQRALILP
jgi:hypothetical protein